MVPIHDHDNDHDDQQRSSPQKSSIELELEDLQNRYALIEALIARNQAQLDSFVNEQEQWESLEPEEQQRLASKEHVEARMEFLAEQLIQLWMGQKSLDGWGTSRRISITSW